MICYECKKSIPDDVGFCPECGAMVKRMGCTGCGKIFNFGTKNCAECGKVLIPLKVCHSCKRVNDDRAGKCRFCGTEFPTYVMPEEEPAGEVIEPIAEAVPTVMEEPEKPAVPEEPEIPEVPEEPEQPQMPIIPPQAPQPTPAEPPMPAMPTQPGYGQPRAAAPAQMPMQNQPVAPTQPAYPSYPAPNAPSAPAAPRAPQPGPAMPMQPGYGQPRAAAPAQPPKPAQASMQNQPPQPNRPTPPAYPSYPAQNAPNAPFAPNAPQPGPVPPTPPTPPMPGYPQPQNVKGAASQPKKSGKKTGLIIGGIVGGLVLLGGIAAALIFLLTSVFGNIKMADDFSFAASSSAVMTAAQAGVNEKYDAVVYEGQVFTVTDQMFFDEKALAEFRENDAYTINMYSNDSNLAFDGGTITAVHLGDATVIVELCKNGKAIQTIERKVLVLEGLRAHFEDVLYAPYAYGMEDSADFLMPLGSMFYCDAVFSGPMEDAVISVDNEEVLSLGDGYYVASGLGTATITVSYGTMENKYTICVYAILPSPEIVDTSIAFDDAYLDPDVDTLAIWVFNTGSLASYRAFLDSLNFVWQLDSYEGNYFYAMGGNHPTYNTTFYSTDTFISDWVLRIDESENLASITRWNEVLFTYTWPGLTN